jgi:hypothetical protein
VLGEKLISEAQAMSTYAFSNSAGVGVPQKKTHPLMSTYNFSNSAGICLTQMLAHLKRRNTRRTSNIIWIKFLTAKQ